MACGVEVAMGGGRWSGVGVAMGRSLAVRDAEEAVRVGHVGPIESAGQPNRPFGQYAGSN